VFVTSGGQALRQQIHHMLQTNVVFVVQKMHVHMKSRARLVFRLQNLRINYCNVFQTFINYNKYRILLSVVGF